MSTETDFDVGVARGWSLADAGRQDEAIAHFLALVERYPNEPRAHFEYAGALDYAGRESDAVAPYRRALALGLSGDDLPRIYVQLGSTLRNVGAFDEAVRFLTEGREHFPDDAAIRIFRALALDSAGRCREAVVELLQLVLAHADSIDLRGYDRAIRHYTDELTG